jgi:hypothetical protein
MAFWKNFLTGVKVALAVGAVINGSKIGDKKINIKELPDIIDLIDKVTTVIEVVKATEQVKDADGGSV